MKCRNPSCGREIVKDQYVAEGDASYAERLATGYCRRKCEREHKVAAPVRASRPLPSLPVASWHTERVEGVEQPKEKTPRDPARLAFARSMPCVCCHSVVGVHAHHVLTGGIGTKCADSFSVSLCYVCHSEVHQIGKLSFENKHGIDLLSVAKDIDKAYNSRK